jgi:peptidoglycan hydrolase-like protein with peptidoglycan-binding domain
MWWTTVRKPPYPYVDGYKLLGFVYPPSANPYPEPTKPVKEGDIGADVKWLQWELAEGGYLRKDEIDGSFGVITLGALLAFQFKNNLEVDGVCGPKTRAMLKMN